ncbi:MAG: OmpH family outer membrane protein [Planctomycetota bacterium]|nr:OmpH family outer membrane protein [Planctomycetota bacterium]MDW8372694.1 OmpH family outer membrane protein [Planctomycetota bacterium]
MRRVLLIALVVSALSAGDSGDAPRYAVIRLIDAINASRSYQERIERFRQEEAQIKARLKEFEDQIQRLSTSLEALPAGSERFLQIQEELEATKARREAYARRVTADFERRQIAIIREQYQLALDRLAEFCRQRGIRLVLQAAERDLAARDLMLMNLRVEMQTALFYDPALDITDAFVGYANQRYADEAAKAGNP